MTRRITYASQLAISLFALQDQKEKMIELAKGLSAILGPTTEIDGFNCTQSIPPALTVDVAGGTIFENQDIDLTPFGTLPSQIPADTDHQILKLAYNLDTTQFSFTPPGTVGFSRADLIQMRLEEKDGASTSIPFYNGTGNPPIFMTKDVLRIDSVIMNVKPGTPATSGTEVPPAPDSGYIGVWVVTTTNGQTTILNADIAPYPNAPFITEKLKDKISQATADARYVTKEQFQYSGPIYCEDTGTTNNIVADLNPAISTYDAGLHIFCKILNTNDGAVVANFNSIGDIDVLDQSGNPLDAGSLVAGMIASFISDGTNLQLMTGSGGGSVLPAGIVQEYAGINIPAGWLEGNGAAVSRTTYAELFNNTTFVQTGSTTNASAVVTGLSSTANMFAGMAVTGTGIPSSTTILSVDSGSQITLSANATATGTPSIRFYPHGAGDGSTTFNILDARSRTFIGAGQGSGLTLRKLGQTGGEEEHVLTIPEMPAHTHGYNKADPESAGFQGGPNPGVENVDPDVTDSTGGGGAHNNMQPYLVIKVIVKT